MAPGERLLNFVWYSNQDRKSLTNIMTDINGHTHRNTVPIGQVRSEVWAQQRMHGNSVLAAPVRELVNKTTQPFLQAVSDTSSPSATFFDNKVLLVGDALFLFRPNIAFSTNQAAYDCTELEKYMRGEISIAEWGQRVVRFGHIHWLRSIWWGQFYQRGKYFAIPSAIRYYIAVFIQALRNRFSKKPASKL